MIVTMFEGRDPGPTTFSIDNGIKDLKTMIETGEGLGAEMIATKAALSKMVVPGLLVVGMTIGAFVTGFLGDQFGRRFTYQINLLIFGLASLAAAAAQDAAGNQLQDELLPPQDDRVAGVMPAGIARYQREVFREHVNDLALALIAPLGADDGDVGHG